MNIHSATRHKQPLLFSTLLFAMVLAVSVCSSLAQIPDTFNPNLNNLSGSNAVCALSFDSSGRVLVGGSFASISGQPRYNLARVNADGAVDSSFNLVVSNVVRSIVRQPDGKILLGGDFTNFAGVTRNGLLRLNADGSLDGAFNPNANGSVLGLALQEDGKILAGGAFTSLGGQSRTGIGRINTNGSLDSNLNVAFSAGTNAVRVEFFVFQSDGRILVVGDFKAVGGQPRTNFARLNIDGTVETNFNPLCSGKIASAAVQADGKILVGGLFTNMCGQSWTNLARLNTNGTLDVDFNPQPDGIVSVINVQADGKIIVTGDFATLAGQPCNRIGRLNTNGTLDAGFNSTVSGVPSVVALQNDGNLMIGGDFFALGGEPRNRLGRLINTDPGTESFVVTDSLITWLRGGTSPEVPATEFSRSMDGTNWIPLGKGVRTEGGWQLGGSGFSTNLYTRARALVSCKASAWWVETMAGPLKCISSPTNQTVMAMSTVIFTGAVIGEGSISYQWWKAGSPLTNSGNVSGATTPTLMVTNVFGPDAGDYFLIASNLTGSVTSTVATLTVIEPVIVVQPASEATNAGQTVNFNVQAVGTSLLSYQWRKNGLPLPDETLPTLTITNVQNADIAAYDVVVSNSYGSVTSAVASLAFSSVLDSLNASVGGAVYATAVQRDGKILIGGSFTSVGGLARSCIARLNVDGSVDTTFNPGADNWVFSIVVEPDDKILVGGWYSRIGGQYRDHVARLNANGSVDTNFNVYITGVGSPIGIYSVALRSNGKILIAGYFRNVGGQSRTNIAQLNADWTVDLSFNSQANDIVYPMILQPDGKVVVGGNFTNLCGVSRQHIGRLNLDGTVDTTFNPGNDNLPLCLALQTDGKIVVGGSFSSTGGQPRTNIARLNPDGTIDPDFRVRASSLVRSVALQADGKILLGGNFATLGSQTNSLLGRLLPDGTPDPTFSWNLVGTAAYSVAVQPDGKVLVGGDFQGGRPYFARLTASGPAIETFTLEGSLARWVRGGTAPQCSLVSFDTVTGTNWTSLGMGQWTNGAWEMAGISTNMTCRMRGLFSGGRYGSSGLYYETNWGPLCILQQPLSGTNALATTASFNVSAAGQGPLTFQWYKESVMLTNNASVAGATTSSLVLSSLLGGTGGDYWVIVSNSSGSVTSSIARLTLLDPILTLQPISRTNNAGSNQTFTVAATGTTPLSYRWFKDGIELASGGNILGAQTAAITVTNLLHADVGSYFAVVSNISGFVTSQVANLNVRDPYISTNPTNTTVNGGVAAVLNVTAAGSALNYQWRKDGADLAAGKAASLTVANAQWLDRGNYTVVVNGSFGSVTSSIAILNVVFPYPAAFTTTDGSLGFTSNRFGFNMRGNSGQVVVIDGSTNLSNWKPIRTNTFGFNSFYFSDPESTNGTGRFYRARLP